MSATEAQGVAVAQPRMRRPRIAVVFPGDPADPTTWSGTPSGVVGGLREARVDVVPVSAAPGKTVHELAWNSAAIPLLRRSTGPGLSTRLKEARVAARIGPAMGRLYGRRATRRLRSEGELDGVIQIGAAYRVETAAPLVTFEDLTIAQAVELGYREWTQGLPRRAVAQQRETQRRVYSKARACCLTTSWAAASVRDDYGIPAAKTYAVGVGRNHSPEPVERQWGTPRFLFVGVEWERKNGPAVVRAFTRLRETCPEARLDVVGGHPQLDADGVEGHGFLRLDVPDERRKVEALFQSATCFVMPSLYEPSALAYVEAGAAGLPSIGTTVGGSAELIGPGGVVVDPRDQAALLEAMRTLAEPETAARLGALARGHSDLFSWRLVAERLLRALRPAGFPLEGVADFL